MAYHIYVFAVTGDPVAQHLLPELAAATMERAAGVGATDFYDGIGIAGCELSSTGHDGVIGLTVNTQPDTIRSMVSWGQQLKGSENLAASDTLLEIVLVGDVDWRVVRAICETGVVRWSGVLCDEASDTVLSLADFG